MLTKTSLSMAKTYLQNAIALIEDAETTTYVKQFEENVDTASRMVAIAEILLGKVKKEGDLK